MMDEVKGLSAGMRFALTRQLAARCVVLMAYVLAGYCVPWLWGLILALVSIMWWNTMCLARRW